jgi:hypothetical protein
LREGRREEREERRGKRGERKLLHITYYLLPLTLIHTAMRLYSTDLCPIGSVFSKMGNLLTDNPMIFHF